MGRLILLNEPDEFDCKDNRPYSLGYALKMLHAMLAKSEEDKAVKVITFATLQTNHNTGAR